MRQAVRTACELLGIELSPERRAALDALDAAGVQALLEQIRRDRRWL